MKLTLSTLICVAIVAVSPAEAQRHGHPRHHRHHTAHAVSRPRSVAPAQAPAQPAVMQACPGADIRPDASNLGQASAAALCLVNDIRATHNLPALVTDASLTRSALAFSLEMVARNFFAHVAPDGTTPLQRILAAGYTPDTSRGYSVGENIAYGAADLSTPAAIVNAWYHSPEHLANILDPAFRVTGMGIALGMPGLGGAGATYTQDFGGVA